MLKRDVTTLIILNENLLSVQEDGLAALRKKYSFVIENSNIIEQYLNSDNGMIQLSEQDKSAIIDKAEDFLDDADEFLDKLRNEKDKIEKSSRTFFYISIGLAIVAELLVLAGTVGLILGCLSMVGALIFTAIGLLKLKDRYNILKRIDDYRDTLLKIKGKSKDAKVKDKIDSIVERINKTLKDSNASAYYYI